MTCEFMCGVHGYLSYEYYLLAPCAIESHIRPYEPIDDIARQTKKEIMAKKKFRSCALWLLRNNCQMYKGAQKSNGICTALFDDTQIR